MIPGMAHQKKIRIGLLVDDNMLPAWAFDMINEISQTNHSRIVLIIKKKSKKTCHYPDKPGWKNRQHWLFFLYRKFENLLFKPVPNAFEKKNLSDLPVKCEIIPVTPEEKDESDIIAEDDMNTIRQYQIDLFLQVGFRALRGGILNCSAYGIWTLQAGSKKIVCNDYAGIWELLNKETTSTIHIIAYSGNQKDGQVIGRSTFRTLDNSINWNRNTFFWKARLLIPRLLEALSRSNNGIIPAHTPTDKSFPPPAKRQTPNLPGNAELVHKVSRLFFTYLKRKFFGLLYREQWGLLVHSGQAGHVPASFSGFKRLIPPKDRLWADPFVIQQKGKDYIFIEEMTFRGKKGHIAVMEAEGKGQYSTPRPVLKRPYHLSYPFIFRHKDQLYMMPETLQNQSIELYKCHIFPDKWQFEKTLISDISATDATLFNYRDTFWLFTSVDTHPGTSINDELFLFYASSLTDTHWTPHPQNPIVSDVRFARPAGNLFIQNGKLLRPAQDCSKHYGYGMQIMEVTTINKETYAEQHAQSIYPELAKEKKIAGTHTLNFSDNLTVSDGIFIRNRLF